jgi:hypothetical protein
VQVDFTNYFTVTGSCTATPPTAVATAKPAAAMQAAATTVLLPLLSEYGRVVGWYLGQGGIDAVAAAAVSEPPFSIVPQHTTYTMTHSVWWSSAQGNS